MEAQQQQQQQQGLQELEKLHAIDRKVKQVQDKMATRLPHQHAHLAAMVCGTTWWTRVRLAKQQEPSAARALYEQSVKKMRLELGAFDYQVKEQGELLTRYLCELDNILSFGNADVKDARKALVVFIQSLLTTADELKGKSGKLKELGEKLISRLPEPAVVESTSEPVATEPAATESTAAQPERKTGQQSAKPASEEDSVIAQEEESEDVQMKPLFATDEEEEEEGSDDDEEEEMEDDEEMEGDEEDQDDEQQQDDDGESSLNNATEPEPQQRRRVNVDVRSLPVWRPYYQIQKRRDGVYLVANLRGIDRENLRVQWIDHAGVLHISGFKLPTQKDIMVSRFNGVPTFGRFEIAERLPTNVLNMEQASQVLKEDGTLEIRMPYYMVQHPRVFRRAFPYETPRCMVW